MNRNEYIGTAIPDTETHSVRDFIDWLVKNLTSKTLFRHGYIDRKSDQNITFSGLEEACERYCWNHMGAPGVQPGSTLASNAEALKALQAALLNAISGENDQDTCDAVDAIMRWGGVRSGNTRWLQTNTVGLSKLLSFTTSALNSGDLNQIAQNIRFNAGMSKIYSLLAKDFIIYDSRVSAAMGWLVVKYCQAKNLTTIPKELKFPWAASRETPNRANQKNRNPSQGGLIFPRLRPGHHHAEWNLKASWILSEVIQRDKYCNFTNPSPIPSLRRLEAALFMIGYDLPKFKS